MQTNHDYRQAVSRDPFHEEPGEYFIMSVATVQYLGRSEMHQVTTTQQDSERMMQLIEEHGSRITKFMPETMDDSEMDTETMYSGISVSTVRPKGETPEERRLRKQAVREDRKQRRVEKKSNQLAFKEKKKEVDRQIMSCRVKTRPIN
ncbi:protein LTV1 like protein [Ditylenchus destructor]|nr:protein LTV1 like protein [Ditylenchus destructor]